MLRRAGVVVCVLAAAILVPAASAVAAPPTNDNFGSAQVLTGASPSATGTNVDATEEVGEPDHALVQTTKSVWYSWTAQTSGQTTVDLCDSNYNTALALYTGNAVGALTPVANNDNNPGCVNGNRSRLTFAATAGTTYHIAVDGYLDFASSASGVIQLDITSAPANDSFANAQTLTGVSPNATGTNVAATEEAGEPDHHPFAPIYATNKSVWYSWTAPSSRQFTVDTCDSGYNTVLAVYTGSPVDALTVVEKNDDAGGCGSGGSQLTFRASAGTTYSIAVDGFTTEFGTSDSGAIQLDISENNSPPTCQAVSDQTAPNTPKSIQLSCTDSDGDPLTLSSLTNPAHGTLGPIDQATDRITYTPTSGYTGPDSFTYWANDGTANSATATVDINVAVAPANDDFADAELLPGTSPSATGTNVNATEEAGEPDHLSPEPFDTTESVWYSWTAQTSGNTTVDLCDSNYDTVLALYTGNAVGALTPVANNDDAPEGCNFDWQRSKQSRLTFPATAGTTYRIAVDGFPGDGNSGAIQLDIRSQPPRCDAVSSSTVQNTATTVQLACTDPNGDALTLSAANPQHGTLSAVDQGTDRVTYTPASGYTGPDSFTYKANNGTNESAPATVSIDVQEPSTSGGGSGGSSSSSSSGSTGSGGATGIGSTPSLTTTFSIAKAKLAQALKKGLAVNFSCTAACSAKFELLMSAKDAKKAKLAAAKPVVIGKGSSRLASAGKKKATVRFTGKAKRRLKRAKKIKATVRSTFTDSSGKRTVTTKKLSIQR